MEKFLAVHPKFVSTMSGISFIIKKRIATQDIKEISLIFIKDESIQDRFTTKAALSAIDDWLDEEIVGFEPEEG